LAGQSAATVDFGRILANARVARGVRQLDLANALGVARSLVSMWEQGWHVPETEHVFALERLLKLPSGHLSQRLGYVPFNSEPVTTVEQAVVADPRLDLADKRAVLAVYRELARRHATR
jgi:transcriptional regulator with XRE-family HTH domain